MNNEMAREIEQVAKDLATGAGLDEYHIIAEDVANGVVHIKSHYGVIMEVRVTPGTVDEVGRQIKEGS